MVSESDIAAIRKASQAYGLKRVLLFGSGADPEAKSRDIDIGVEGLDARLFFRFCGDLMFRLSLPVDVFDLSRPSRFADLIRREGIPIYG